MKKFILFIGLFICTTATFGTTWTVTAPGTFFSPSLITIVWGDTVIFNINGTHNAVEVSQTTWNANGSAPLPGGFALGFGGGTLFSATLSVGTHYYVCSPHVTSGMKGRIIVQSGTGIASNAAPASLIRTFPNPFASKMIIEAPGIDVMNLHNILGEQVNTFEIKNSYLPFEYSPGNLPNGVYFLSFMKEGKTVETRKVVKLESKW